MASQVERALLQGRALLVEAGTGTGKTLAYLLPAARSGLKVVISTATKTLQEQLADKDVPLVQALGVTARFAFLKGRQNYLCLLRKEHFDRQPTFAVREEAGMYGQLHSWAPETAPSSRACPRVSPPGGRSTRPPTPAPGRSAPTTTAASSFRCGARRRKPTW